jgi:hypothetical protein
VVAWIRIDLFAITNHMNVLSPAEFTLSSRFNVVVGRNNVGQTVIIELAARTHDLGALDGMSRFVHSGARALDV